MISTEQLEALDPETRRAMLTLLAELRAKVELIAQRDREAAFKQALIERLTHENALLKLLNYAATSERFAASVAPEQRSLLEETLDSDLAELELEIQRERRDAGDKSLANTASPFTRPSLGLSRACGSICWKTNATASA